MTSRIIAPAKLVARLPHLAPEEIARRLAWLQLPEGAPLDVQAAAVRLARIPSEDPTPSAGMASAVAPWHSR